MKIIIHGDGVEMDGSLNTPSIHLHTIQSLNTATQDHGADQLQPSSMLRTGITRSKFCSIPETVHLVLVE